MKKLIADGWREFEIDVIPLNAPDIQRTECRRAFYAGAISIFNGLLSELRPGAEPTDADLKVIDALAAEIKQYADDLKAGRA